MVMEAKMSLIVCHPQAGKPEAGGVIQPESKGLRMEIGVSS